MKKALKICAGALGIGYAVWTAFALGNALPLATALCEGEMEEANCISDNICKTYGKDSFITNTILNSVKTGMNLGYKVLGEDRNLSYTKY